MGSSQQVWLRIGAPQAAWFELHHGRRLSLDSWLQIEGEVPARDISRRFDAVVVDWSYSSTVELIWLYAYESGDQCRQLLFNEGRWQVTDGTPFQFEDTRALKRELRSRSPDAYAVLNAFLGKEHQRGGVVAAEHLDESTTPAVIQRAADAAQAERVASVRRVEELRRQSRSLVFFQANEALAAQLRTTGRTVEVGAWVPYLPRQGIDICVFSRSIGTTVVYFSFSREFGSLSFMAGQNGDETRFIMYSESSRHWMPSGSPLPCEDRDALAKILSSTDMPDADQFLRAMLGPQVVAGEPVSANALAGGREL